MRLFTLGYVHRDGRTLMLRRNRKPNDVHAGKWVGLGGKMEEGESPAEGIIREVYEESGLVVTDPILKSIVTIPGFKDGETWHMFVYLIESFTGELASECAE